MRISLFFAFILSFLACSTSQKQEVADTVFYNGQFFTADSTTEGSTALAVKDGKIMAIGDDSTMLLCVGAKTQRIDLKGSFLMPGLIEGHGHFNATGNGLINVNLMGIDNWDVALEKVAERLKTAKPEEWIEGRGWHQEKWSKLPAKVVQGYPLHTELSALSPNNPVVLGHASGHALLANAKAMELAGISVETPDPVGGRILRDAKGQPTGVFEENAMLPIEKALENFRMSQSEAEQEAAFEKSIGLASQHCLEHGITSFQDAGSTFEELDRYKKMAENGKLPIRLWAMVAQPATKDIAKLKNFPWLGLADDHLTVRAVKAYLDGALGSYGAWLLAPYADKPNMSGQNTTPIEEVAAIADACQAEGLQCCVHAIGDRANREMLDLFAKKMKGNTSLRWRIEHAQHIDSTDIPRFGLLGIIASMQAIHCTSDAPFVEKRLGATRARTGAYAWRSLLDYGAHLTNGTDTPVETLDPLPNIYAACTRKRLDSDLAFYPEQCMTRKETLLSYTLWNAYAAFEENEKGSLSIGKKADLVVFSKNLEKCPEEEILQAKTLLTVLDGQIMYENLNFLTK